MADSVMSSSVDKDAILGILTRAFVHRYHSLAQYILDAGPYVRADDEPLLRRIREIAAYDHAAAERLADVIEELDGIPQAPPYQHEFAELNYLSLTYLKDFLREQLAEQLADYERGLPRLGGCALARNAVHSVCQALRAQISELRSFPETK